MENIIINCKGIYGEEKEQLFINSDIFVHTSRNEGLPTSVIEAMIYKKPVLVTKGTNMYEVVKKNKCGWGAENDVKSISQQFEKIIEEKDKIKEYGENAYKYAKENYEWNNVVRKTIKKYEECIKKVKK